MKGHEALRGSFAAGPWVPADVPEIHPEKLQSIRPDVLETLQNRTQDRLDRESFSPGDLAEPDEIVEAVSDARVVFPKDFGMGPHRSREGTQKFHPPGHAREAVSLADLKLPCQSLFAEALQTVRVNAQRIQRATRKEPTHEHVETGDRQSL